MKIFPAEWDIFKPICFPKIAEKFRTSVVSIIAQVAINVEIYFIDEPFKEETSCVLLKDTFRTSQNTKNN